MNSDPIAQLDPTEVLDRWGGRLIRIWCEDATHDERQHISNVIQKPEIPASTADGGVQPGSRWDASVVSTIVADGDRPIPADVTWGSQRDAASNGTSFHRSHTFACDCGQNVPILQWKLDAAMDKLQHAGCVDVPLSTLMRTIELLAQADKH